jgi:uncharacterized protein YrrD
MQVNLVEAAVHTRDGEAGRVWRVAVEPKSRKVTHLVIHKGLLLGRNVVVPIEAVVRMQDGHVHLDLSNDELECLPDFQETDFLAPEEGWEYPLGYPPGGVIWPLSMPIAGASPYPYMSNAVIKENIPEDDVSLAAGTDVECVDGHCGRIERVLVDDQTKEMTGFVIKRGFFFTRDVEAPLDWIDHVENHAVYLKLTKKQVAELTGH